MQVRPMRRGKQELPYEEAIGILRAATSGVLSLQGDDGYPYAVPLSYAVEEDVPVEDEDSQPSDMSIDSSTNPARGRLRIYFHCALQGYKLDCIARNEKASFCAVGSDDVVPEEFTTYFRSAVAFGRVRVVSDHDERVHALRLLADKYARGFDEGFAREVTTLLARTCILRFDVDALTGKEAIELVRARTV